MKAICNDGKHFITLELSVSDYQRVKACLNAMDGIEDPAAARVILNEPQTLAAADMLQALKQLTDVAKTINDDHLVAAVRDAARVIAKAEGRSHD